MLVERTGVVVVVEAAVVVVVVVTTVKPESAKEIN
jgi:hypothetical protein